MHIGGSEEGSGGATEAKTLFTVENKQSWKVLVMTWIRNSLQWVMLKEN